jgi:hypothetical protein
MTRKIWQIENYDDEARRTFKVYAAINGITIAQALTVAARLLSDQMGTRGTRPSRAAQTLDSTAPMDPYEAIAGPIIRPTHRPKTSRGKS